MLYFDNRPQMQKFFNEHTIEQSPEVIKTHKNQKYILMGTTTEKHGNFWKFSRLLRIIMLAIPSLCSKKQKENFSISIAEFKSGKSKLSIYALEKILDKEPLENQTQLTIQKSQEIEKNKPQGKKTTQEEIHEIGKIPDLEERKIKLGQFFSKLETSQIIEYLENYENQLKQTPEKFKSDREAISVMQNLLNTKEQFNNKSSSNLIFQIKLATDQDMVRKFGKVLTDADIQKAKSLLEDTYGDSYKTYEDLYTEMENAYLNVILGCQMVNVEVSNVCLKHMYENSQVMINKHRFSFNEAQRNFCQSLERELGIK